MADSQWLPVAPQRNAASSGHLDNLNASHSSSGRATTPNTNLQTSTSNETLSDGPSYLGDRSPPTGVVWLTSQTQDANGQLYQPPFTVPPNVHMFPSPSTPFTPGPGGYIPPGNPENLKTQPDPRPFPWRLVVLVAIVSVLITAGITAGVTVPLLSAKASSCSESNSTAMPSPTSGGGSTPILTLPVDIRVNQPLTGGTVRYNVKALQDMTRLIAYTNPASPGNSTSFIFAVQRGLNADERRFFGGSCGDYEEGTGCQVDYGGFKLAVGNVTAPVTYAPFPIEKTNGLQIHYGGLSYRVSPCQPGFTTLLIQCDKSITGVPPNISYIEPVPCSFVVSMSHAAGCTL